MLSCICARMCIHLYTSMRVQQQEWSTFQSAGHHTIMRETYRVTYRSLLGFSTRVHENVCACVEGKGQMCHVWREDLANVDCDHQHVIPARNEGSGWP